MNDGVVQFYYDVSTHIVCQNLWHLSLFIVVLLIDSSSLLKGP
jgi:hypothetical protein